MKGGELLTVPDASSSGTNTQSCPTPSGSPLRVNRGIADEPVSSKAFCTHCGKGHGGTYHLCDVCNQNAVDFDLRAKTEINMSSVDVTAGLAWSANKNNLAIGLEFIEEAIRIDPQNGNYINTQGLILYSLGKKNEGRACFEGALSCDLSPHDRIQVRRNLEDSKPKCFVATAAYGDYDSPEVVRYRKFRDNTLQHYWWGKLFISAYYACSPPLADVIAKRESLRKLSRAALNRLMAILKI